MTWSLMVSQSTVGVGHQCAVTFQLMGRVSSPQLLPIVQCCDFDSGTVTETRMVIERRNKKIEMSLWQRGAVVPNTRDEFPAWMLVVRQWFGNGNGFKFYMGFVVTTIGDYATISQVPPITSYFLFFCIYIFCLDHEKM